MNNFEYYAPTKVVFGRGAEEKTGQLTAQLGKKKVLIIHGRSAKASGLVDKVQGSLAAAGVAFVSAGGVQANPLLSQAERLLDIARAQQVDFIIAVGGGSVIDAAKAVSIGLANPEVPIWDFFLHKQRLEKTCGLGAVLTLSASGSEMSDSCVLTRDEGRVKMGLSSDLNRPAFAIMNPENTFSLPLYQVGCGIADIMMHTMERYFGANLGNEMTDQIAEALLRVVIENGRIAIKDPKNYAAASELMWAGSLSHNNLTGLGAQGDFAVHQLGHELSAEFDVAHGASLTAVWGSWAWYVYQTNPARFARFARLVWGIAEPDDDAAALAAIRTTEDYFRTLGLPTSLPELEAGQLSDEMLRKLTVKCTRQHTRTIGHFQVLEEEDIYRIYQAANVQNV